MRFPTSSLSLLTHLLRRRHISVHPQLLTRRLHTPTATPPSRFLQHLPAPPPSSDPAADGSMNEFLSRFTHSARATLRQAFPDVPRPTLNAMLLVICQKVIDAMDNPTPNPNPDTETDDLDLSPDLWATIWEISASVHADMDRDRKRAEFKKYLHCDEVKEMCRFAVDAGVRGSLLREFRVKWTKEKMEEVELERELEQIRTQVKKRETIENGEGVVEEAGRVVLTELPRRRGEIKYKIYGLDLSGPEWEKVFEKQSEAQKLLVKDEAQLIVGRAKKVDDRILALGMEDDVVPVLEEWAKMIEPTRADWVALLARIRERNEDLYIKISDLLLTEKSFEANIRDYSRLIDAHTKAGRIGDAEGVLQKMTERGIVPDVLTSNILVHMYSKTGNLDQAKVEFANLRNQGFKPDLKTYSSMITACVKAGSLTEGENILKDTEREMEKRGIKPTKEMYMELLGAYSKCGQLDGAQRILNMMLFSGMQPTLESFTLLVEACRQAGERTKVDFVDHARAQFDHMMRCSIRPDDRCTASMLATYAAKNLLDKALELLVTLEKDGFQPGIATYTVLVDWMGRLQLVDEAERFLSAIREKGEAPFEIHVSLCDMYARAGLREKALKSLKTLEGRKEALREGHFERIVTGLLESGFTEEAKRMYDVMQAQGFTSSQPLRVKLKAAQTIPQQARNIPQQNPYMKRGGRF